MGIAKKKKNHRIVGEWSVVILIAFIASVAILFSLGNRGLHQRLEENKARLQLIAENTAKEKVRSEALKKKEERYQSDEYIEEIAREKLGLVYPDEIILKPVN